MQNTAHLLTSLISEDIEAAQLAVMAETPTSQQHLLREALRQILCKESKYLDAIKLLGIMQSILSGSYVFLEESEVLALLQEILDLYILNDSVDEPQLNLDQLIETTPRFKIGLEVSKILATKNFNLLNNIPSDRWAEFSHLGTRLAKVFRASGDWKRFEDVYFDFARHHVSSENLSVASWAEMFPNTPQVETIKAYDFFSQQVTELVTAFFFL